MSSQITAYNIISNRLVVGGMLDAAQGLELNRWSLDKPRVNKINVTLSTLSNPCTLCYF